MRNQPLQATLRNQRIGVGFRDKFVRHHQAKDFRYRQAVFRNSIGHRIGHQKASMEDMRKLYLTSRGRLNDNNLNPVFS